MVMRVAVIGCGAAGLSAMRHLSARPDMFQGVGFEQGSGVGGTWRYTDKTGVDANGLPVQTSMYRNLRTNIPKEVMAYPDFPFDKHLPSFLSHTQVLEYLEAYSQKNKLSDYIKFNTKVNNVEPVENGGRTEWRVTYSPVSDSLSAPKTSIFNALMICSGHYSVPLMPDIKGMNDFQGQIIHSHDYRLPSTFKDKVVVCLGGNASGQDIGLDIAKVAKKVVISHNKNIIESELPANVSQQSGIQDITPTTIVFKNGEEVAADVLMLCTGYRYSFPYLSDKCEVEIKDERITPLFKHIVHTKYPTMSFIGMCKIICPFPQFDNQVRFVLSTLDGSLDLPNTNAMDADIADDFSKRLSEGLPTRYAHFMGPRQWEYNDSLATLAGFQPIPKAIQKLYNEVHRTRVLDLLNYKTKQYRITGEETYEEISASLAKETSRREQVAN